MGPAQQTAPWELWTQKPEIKGRQGQAALRSP